MISRAVHTQYGITWYIQYTSIKFLESNEQPFLMIHKKKTFRLGRPNLSGLLIDFDEKLSTPAADSIESTWNLRDESRPFLPSSMQLGKFFSGLAQGLRAVLAMSPRFHS